MIKRTRCMPSSPQSVVVCDYNARIRVYEFEQERLWPASSSWVCLHVTEGVFLGNSYTDIDARITGVPDQLVGDYRC